MFCFLPMATDNSCMCQFQLAQSGAGRCEGEDVPWVIGNLQELCLNSSRCNLLPSCFSPLRFYPRSELQHVPPLELGPVTQTRPALFKYLFSADTTGGQNLQKCCTLNRLPVFCVSLSSVTWDLGKGDGNDFPTSSAAKIPGGSVEIRSCLNEKLSGSQWSGLCIMNYESHIPLNSEPEAWEWSEAWHHQAACELWQEVCKFDRTKIEDAIHIPDCCIQMKPIGPNVQLQ